MPRAVLLDLGKVLVRFDHGLTLARLEAATGVAAKALRPHVFGPLERAFDLGRVEAPEFFRSVEAAAGLPRVPDDVWVPAWRDIFTPDQEALALVARLAPSVTPVLVSNTNALHWEGVLRVAPDLPGLLPLRALSFEVGAAKPDPAHFEAALALAGAAPREAVFADDRAEMVEAARRLGLDAFAVDRPDALETGLTARGLLAPHSTGHPLFTKGLAEFRSGRFFEAHEEWEALWRHSAGDAKLFLQALIQLAAACVHLERGNRDPGFRLLSLAQEKLDRSGKDYAGISVVLLRRGILQAQQLLEAGGAPGEVARTLQL